MSACPCTRSRRRIGEGGNSLLLFQNGFIQAFVLGQLIGVSQATTLRGLTSRWAWWFAANVTTYLAGVLLRDLGVWLQHTRILAAHMTPYFPVVAIAIHGAWMLWVTAPQAARQARSPQPAASVASRAREALPDHEHPLTAIPRDRELTPGGGRERPPGAVTRTQFSRTGAVGGMSRGRTLGSG